MREKQEGAREMSKKEGNEGTRGEKWRWRKIKRKGEIEGCMGV